MAVSKLALTLFVGALGGCASYSPSDVAKPSDITVDKAMKDVAAAIHNIEAAYPPARRIGLIVDEVQISST